MSICFYKLEKFNKYIFDNFEPEDVEQINSIIEYAENYIKNQKS